MEDNLQLLLEESQQLNDVPDSPATGSFAVSLSGNRLSVSGRFSNLTSALMPVGGADSVGNPESAIHIHVGAVGANGPILRNLMVEADSDDPTAGEFEGEFELSDEQVATLINDGLYVNLHTMSFPAGELRGQIDIEPTVMVAGIPLEESQQLNDVPDTAATGSFSVTLVGNRLMVEGTFSDLTSALMPVGGADSVGNPESAIHIHMGEVGENGPIVRNLTVDEAAGTFEGLFTLSDEQVSTFTADGLYVNVHTMDFPSGELRGQINIDEMTGSSDGIFLVRDAGDTAALFGTDADEFIAGRDGDNSLFGAGGNDTLIGDLDDASGNDIAFGGSGDDLIIGGLGNDTIGGEIGNDTLIGDAGSDVLLGGGGSDILIGGSGSDVFVLAAGAGESIITDFESGDLIGLAGGISSSDLYKVQDGSNTVIGTFGGDLLAIALNTNVDQLSDSAFLAV